MAEEHLSFSMKNDGVWRVHSLSTLCGVMDSRVQTRIHIVLARRGSMDDQYLDLETQIQEIKDFHREWVEEFVAYYEDGEDVKGVPHKRLRRRGEAFIEAAIEHHQHYRDEAMADVNPSEIFLLFSAFGTEVLLNGILLKEDWETFKRYSEFDENRSPQFSDCVKWLMGNLPDRFGQPERRRIRLVLELLQEQRNNAVHLGYKRMGHHSYYKEVYRVLNFILDHYYNEPGLGYDLEELVEKREKHMASSLDYEPVDF